MYYDPVTLTLVGFFFWFLLSVLTLPVSTPLVKGFSDAFGKRVSWPAAALIAWVSVFSMGIALVLLVTILGIRAIIRKWGVRRFLMGFGIGTGVVAVIVTTAVPVANWIQFVPVEAGVRHALGRLADGTVVVAGGDSAALYDPSTNSWARTGRMARQRGTTAMLLPDGRAFVMSSGRAREVYDPFTNSWFSAASMQDGRENPASVLLGDGRVLVVGGTHEARVVGIRVTMASAEIYDPSTDSWSPADSMAQARGAPGAVLLSDGKVLVVGGWVSDRKWEGLASAEIYDPSTDSWSRAGSMAQGRGVPVAVLLPDGRVLVIGGIGGPGPVVGNSLAGAEVYDPSTNSWFSAGWMEKARYSHTAVTLADGRVLVTGGRTREHPRKEVLALAEIYDPSTDSWSRAGSMAQTREDHSAVLLADGRVLVVGGRAWPNGSLLASTEIYDPLSDSWSHARGGRQWRFWP